MKSKMKKIENFLDKESDTPKYTWREWLKHSLNRLLTEGEMFDSKRPMGFSGWESTLQEHLESCGLTLSDLLDHLFQTEDCGYCKYPLNEPGEWYYRHGGKTVCSDCYQERR